MSISVLLLSLTALLFSNQTADIVFAGDAMQHQKQLEAAHRADGSYDYSSYFPAVTSYVTAADFAVINLETPLGGKPYSGYPMFCAPDSYLDAIADAGFDLILGANNHCLDRRDKGILRTIDQFEKRHMPYAGIYRNQAARDSIMPLIQDINGFKVAFLNYTYGTNGMTRTTDVGLDYIDRDLISKDVEAARKAGAEIVTACVHWGDEYKLLPNTWQKDLAKYLKSLGIDLIIGGHPHVIQPMEMYDNEVTGRKGLLVYSLGNYISAMRTPDTRGGAMVRVTLARDSVGNAVVDNAAYSLVFVETPTRAGANFRLLPAESDELDPAWRPARNQFIKNATAIFDKHNVDVPREFVQPK